MLESKMKEEIPGDWYALQEGKVVEFKDIRKDCEVWVYGRVKAGSKYWMLARSEACQNLEVIREKLCQPDHQEMET